MTAAIIRELADHPELLHRLTVDAYHEMIATGKLAEGDPFELLDGQIVRKIRSLPAEELTMEGPRHALIIQRCGSMSPLFAPLGCHVRLTHPITLPPHDEPEPDAAIVRGSQEDYAHAHPGPADVLCVIEVSGTSLRRDRGYKLELYANSGLPMYVIFNLVETAVEVYSEPVVGEGRDARISPVPLDGTLAFPTAAGEQVVVPVRQLFP